MRIASLVLAGVAFIGYLIVAPTGEPPPLPEVRRIDAQADRSALRYANLQSGKLVYKIDPRHPEAVRRLELRSLSLWTQMTVDEYGKVKSVEIANGNPLCNDADRESFRRWRHTLTPVKLVVSVRLHVSAYSIVWIELRSRFCASERPRSSASG
jgi:hypothetical protein